MAIKVASQGALRDTKERGLHAMENLGLKKRATQPAHAVANDELGKDGGKSRTLLPDRTVWIVFFSLLVDLLAFTIILPLFPSLLEFYASNREVSVLAVL